MDKSLFSYYYSSTIFFFKLHDGRIECRTSTILFARRSNYNSLMNVCRPYSLRTSSTCSPHVCRAIMWLCVVYKCVLYSEVAESACFAFSAREDQLDFLTRRRCSMQPNWLSALFFPCPDRHSGRLRQVQMRSIRFDGYRIVTGGAVADVSSHEPYPRSPYIIPDPHTPFA